MKLKFVAAAAALLCGSTAFAAINNGVNGPIGNTEAEVFAMVWDEAEGTYAIDLGITIKGLFSLTANTTLGTVAGKAWDSYLAADAKLDDFTEFEGGTRWGLFAVQGDGSIDVENSLQYLTSSTLNRVVKLDNGGAEALNSAMVGFTGTLNQSGLGTNVAVNGDTFNAFGTPANYLELVNIGSTGAFAGNAIGNSSVIYLCGVSSFDSFAPANCGVSSTLQSVSFDGTSFTATAVPEPSTYALMAFGFLAVCAAVRRRVG